MNNPLPTTKTLPESLDEWWAIQKSNRNRWNATPVGIAIKRMVKEAGNWKNAPRGSPQRAGQVSALRRGNSPFG